MLFLSTLRPDGTALQALVSDDKDTRPGKWIYIWWDDGSISKYFYEFRRMLDGRDISYGHDEQPVTTAQLKGVRFIGDWYRWITTGKGW